jgi:glutathione S-transferase
MSSPEPLVRFYDLSGPKTWSPACWSTRYALNYKGIPYSITKLSYPAIRPTCEKLFPDMTGLEATVPIIEILGPNHKALNNSTPIAELLNERFTEEAGYKHLKGIEEVKKYEAETASLGLALLRWVIQDVWENALDPNDCSREYFKKTREAVFNCELKDVTELRGGGEAAVIEDIKKAWALLRDRMKGEDGTGERKSSISPPFTRVCIGLTF